MLQGPPKSMGRPTVKKASLHELEVSSRDIPRAPGHPADCSAVYEL